MLYVVGTPIGNLEDITLRAAKTLCSVDILLCEDTRSAGFLLQKIPEMFSLKRNENQQMVSYFKEKEFEKLPYVLELLEDGKDIALISEAGLPLISDPGYLLVSTLIKKEIPFTVLPGPSAATTALMYSGFSPERVLYTGFLPKKESALKALFSEFKRMKETSRENLVIVAYDSPSRIQETLEILDVIIPSAHVAVARELTKLYEEIVRGTPHDLKHNSYKGEISLVIEIT